MGKLGNSTENLNLGKLLPGSPLKNGNGFKARGTHSCPNQIRVTPQGIRVGWVLIEVNREVVVVTPPPPGPHRPWSKSVPLTPREQISFKGKKMKWVFRTYHQLLYPHNLVNPMEITKSNLPAGGR